jgi:hypothetical protein
MPFCDLVDEFLNKHCKVEKSSYKRDIVISRVLKKHFGRTPIGWIKTYGIMAWRERRSAHITKTATGFSVSRRPSKRPTTVLGSSISGSTTLGTQRRVYWRLEGVI